VDDGQQIDYFTGQELPGSGEGESMIRSEAEVEELVRDNQKLVDYMVNRYLKRFYVGDMERDDLVSWGMIGLLQAARAWDPERSRSFSTLACKAIERMIIRGVSREWKPEQAAATLSLDGLVFGEESEGREARFVDQVASEEDVEQRLLDSETGMEVRSALERLQPEQRRLIERHFYEGVPVRELAQELGLTRQGVYVRQRNILQQLKESLTPALAA
jgi:RNA polymerase sigma factor (sigma-70 family)